MFNIMHHHPIGNAATVSMYHHVTTSPTLANHHPSQQQQEVHHPQQYYSSSPPAASHLISIVPSMEQQNIEHQQQQYINHQQYLSEIESQQQKASLTEDLPNPLLFFSEVVRTPVSSPPEYILLLSNVPAGLGADQIHDTFELFGEIVYCRMLLNAAPIHDRKYGHSPDCCVIVFKSPGAVITAAAYNELIILGRPVYLHAITSNGVGLAKLKLDHTRNATTLPSTAKSSSSSSSKVLHGNMEKNQNIISLKEAEKKTQEDTNNTTTTTNNNSNKNNNNNNSTKTLKKQEKELNNILTLNNNDNKIVTLNHNYEQKHEIPIYKRMDTVNDINNQDNNDNINHIEAKNNDPYNKSKINDHKIVHKKKKLNDITKESDTFINSSKPKKVIKSQSAVPKSTVTKPKMEMDKNGKRGKKKQSMKKRKDNNHIKAEVNISPIRNNINDRKKADESGSNKKKSTTNNGNVDEKYELASGVVILGKVKQQKMNHMKGNHNASTTPEKKGRKSSSKAKKSKIQIIPVARKADSKKNRNKKNNRNKNKKQSAHSIESETCVTRNKNMDIIANGTKKNMKKKISPVKINRNNSINNNITDQKGLMMKKDSTYSTTKKNASKKESIRNKGHDTYNTNNIVLPKSEYKKSVSKQQFRRNRNTLVFGNVNDFDYDEPSSANRRYVIGGNNNTNNNINIKMQKLHDTKQQQRKNTNSISRKSSSSISSDNGESKSLTMVAKSRQFTNNGNNNNSSSNSNNNSPRHQHSPSNKKKSRGKKKIMIF